MSQTRATPRMAGEGRRTLDAYGGRIKITLRLIKNSIIGRHGNAFTAFNHFFLWLVA